MKLKWHILIFLNEKQESPHPRNNIFMTYFSAWDYGSILSVQWPGF